MMEAGWYFSLEEASTLAWFTAPDPREVVPDFQQAHKLLQKLAGEGSEFADEFLIAGPEIARRMIGIAREYCDGDQSSAEHLSNAASRIHDVLRTCSLFAVGIAETRRQHNELNELMYAWAQETGERALMLIPDHAQLDTGLSMLAPFPAFMRLTNVAVTLPAVLFWTRTGAAHLCTLEEGKRVFASLKLSLSDGAAVDAILKAEQQCEQQCPSFLHISDLHFGASDVGAKQQYLALQLREIGKTRKLKRAVITGDLMNGPNAANATAFSNFKHQLSDMLGQEPIIIPGNHDQKPWWGIWGRSWRELADIDWRDVVVDDDLGVIFLCFDSSRNAKYAKGKVTVEQRVGVATALSGAIARDPKLKDYLRVALVHHHPFTFPERDSGIWRIFSRFGFTRESMLRMDDADNFVSWCALQRATLILHGHKHVPWHVEDSVEVDPATGRTEYIDIRSVGCGSSTGVGNWPLSINCLTWIPALRRWSVSFLIDRGDGAGFRDAEIAIVVENTAVAHSAT